MGCCYTEPGFIPGLHFPFAQGFDFNRVIYDGISSMPLAWRDQKLAALQRGSDDVEESRPEAAGAAMPENVEQFKQELISEVGGWGRRSSAHAADAH